MDHFIPKDRNHQRVSLPLQFSGYTTNFVWPLKENPSRLKQLLRKSLLLVSLISYAGTIFAELNFIYENAGNIAAIAECLSTTFMGLQYSSRLIVLGGQYNRMRDLLRRFYRDIYFTEAQGATFRQQINRRMWIINAFTKLNYAPMILIFINFFWDLFNQGMSSQSKPYFYRMSFPWYDAQEPSMYALTSIYTGWLTYSCVVLMSASDMLLCTVLLHTSYRFKEIQLELSNLFDDAVGESRRQGLELHRVFRYKLYCIFRQQQILHRFIRETVKPFFSYPIFCTMFFGVLLQCVVLFQFQRASFGIGWIKYVSWIAAQTGQLMMIGYFGQTLMDDTMEMHNSYYMSQWENLLPHGNASVNKLLMNDIKFAIMGAQTALVLDGMKMFSLTHSSVGSALRSSTSYFMFLNTMNDANKSK